MEDAKQYEKLKCVFCGYEMATLAKIPRCTRCGSRRFNAIETFSVTKPFKQKLEGETMSKDKEKKAVDVPKPEVSKKPEPEPEHHDYGNEDDEDNDLDKHLFDE